MDGTESIVVTGCEGGRGGGGDGAGGGVEAGHSAPTLSPTPPQLAAFSSGVVGVTGMPMPPSEGTGLAMGMMGSGGYGGSSEGDLSARKKRGRPRKYGSDGMALALSPTSGSASPFSPASSDAKRGRGRPPGSGKRQLLAALGKVPPVRPTALFCLLIFEAVLPCLQQHLSFFPYLLFVAYICFSRRRYSGEWFACSAGGSFTPHVVTIATGEDVAARILSFSQKGPRAICILSANGAISNVTLRQPGSSGGTLTYEGRFEILSLSGSFTITETGGIRSRTGGISVSLAGPDGRVIGGGVAGLLLAASPIQVVVGSFMPNVYKEKQAKPTHQAQPSALPGATGLLTAAMPISQANPEEDCETPTSSSLPGQSHAENSMFSPNPNSNWHGLQSSEHKPSPDINVCLQGE
ncbi:hypothetical protein MUK42_14602 [Musa troglodytarum]|uniref:AT-hook motif nuclear-localized protein n=1 Tax=Musa troglodytarum TaxID=320322 RepID=A0A9E7IK79_9LILI|nr:hypothetical protein MUK42_14602 [Musa troglodytarum]